MSKAEQKQTGFLSRDAILKAVDRPFEDVFVKDWNGSVRVRAMSAKERDGWETAVVAAQENGDRPNIRARLVVCCACDDNDKPLFSIDDADALGEKSAKALDQLFEVAQRLCGLGDRQIKEMEGNS